MNNFNKLCANSLSGERVVFSITDVPVAADTDNFILMRRDHTPILVTSSVVVGSDIDGVFEGTRIADKDGNLYNVSFQRGFAAMDKNRNVFKLHKLAPFTIVGDNYDLSTCCRARLIYKHDNVIFRLTDIVGVVEDKVVIKNKYLDVNFTDVQQFAGLAVDGNKVFLGDTLPVGKVCMHYGRICVYNNGIYTDLVDGEVIPDVCN